MSIDNGIYVLATEDQEWRVVHAQNIEEIYGDYDDDEGIWLGNKPMIKEFFENSQVFKTLQEAWDYAFLLEQNYEFLEDGVCLIDDFNHLKFSDL